jgi:thiamine-phosphate pyrophosphorylase
MTLRIDVSLYAIIDEDYVGTRDLVPCATELARSGVSMIQYRAKNLPSREFLLRAISIENALRGSAVPLIINDRADIALLSGARGVHLGSEDIPIEKAREILGFQRIIGITAYSTEDALRAEREGADYIGAGLIFPSPTKGDAPIIGLAGLKEIKSSVKIPVVAIGGLTLEKVSQVIEGGADGLAFISELWGSGEIGKKARALRAAIDLARRG